MSVDSLENTSASTTLPARAVRVVNWPVRDDPLCALAAAAGCAALGVVSGSMSASWSMGLLTTLAFMLSLWKLWIPIACDLGPAGITLSAFGVRRHLGWRLIERVQPTARGVLIRGSEVAARPGSGRTLYLPWRRLPHLVTEFHDHYRPAARDANVKSPGTSPR